MIFYNHGPNFSCRRNWGLAGGCKEAMVRKPSPMIVVVSKQLTDTESTRYGVECIGCSG